MVRGSRSGEHSEMTVDQTLFSAETPPDIKHYVIKTQRAPRKSIFQSKKKLPLEYFIGHTKFNSLQELIERYQQEQGGLCCRLAKSSAERNDYFNTVHFISFWTVHFIVYWTVHFHLEPLKHKNDPSEKLIGYFR